MYQINALNPKQEGHQARKRFGQNFLHDQRVIAKIVRSVNPRPGENILEIGPGLAALTSPLIGECDALTVIELDRDLAAGLPGRVPHPERLTIIEADALKYDYSELFKEDRPLRVVGNLPYNISTPLLFHLLEFGDKVNGVPYIVIGDEASWPGYQSAFDDDIKKAIKKAYENEDYKDIVAPLINSSIGEKKDEHSNDTIITVAILVVLVGGIGSLVYFSRKKQK